MFHPLLAIIQERNFRPRDVIRVTEIVRSVDGKKSMNAARTGPFDDKAFEDTMMGATSQYSSLLPAYPLFQGFHSHSASGRRAIMSLIWTISILGIAPKSLLDATANGMKRHHSPTWYQNRCFD